LGWVVPQRVFVRRLADKPATSRAGKLYCGVVGMGNEIGEWALAGSEAI
jgi:hypothetical protein